MEQKLKEAVARWYKYVGQDHHKDRDCHWEIGQSVFYSYAGVKEDRDWFVRHQGYITEYEDYGATFDEVAQKTIDFIDNYIEKYPNLPPLSL